MIIFWFLVPCNNLGELFKIWVTLLLRITFFKDYVFGTAGAFHQSDTLFDHNLSFSGSLFRFSANINLSTTTYKNQDPTLTLSPSSFYQLIASAFHHFYQNHSHFLQNQDQTLFKKSRKNLATLLFKIKSKTKIKKKSQETLHSLLKLLTYKLCNKLCN